MKLKFVLAATAMAVFAAGMVSAADEPQVVRKAQMKAIGGASGALNAIAKGQKPYDAEAVKAALTTISTNIKAFPNQFPAGTETGLDTIAGPKIWEDMAGFKAEAAKLAATADAQLAQLPADAAGVGAALQMLGGTCGECHQAYRLKR